MHWNTSEVTLARQEAKTTCKSRAYKITETHSCAGNNRVIIGEARAMGSTEIWENMLHESARSERQVKLEVAASGASVKNKSQWGWASQHGLIWRDIGRFQGGLQDHKDKTITTGTAK